MNMDLLSLDGMGEKLIDMTTSHGLLQQVTLPTRQTVNTGTLIDHIYTKSNKYLETNVIQTDILDHYPTITHFHDTCAPNSGTTITKRWFVEATYEAIQILLQECNNDWDKMETMGLVEATEYLSSKITEILDIIAPVETKKMSKKPINKWITQGIKISLKNVNQQYKALQSGRLPKKEYVKYKKILGNVIRASKQLYYKSAIETATTNSRKLWSIVNEVIDRKQCRHKIPMTFNINGVNISNAKGVSNRLMTTLPA